MIASHVQICGNQRASQPAAFDVHSQPLQPHAEDANLNSNAEASHQGTLASTPAGSKDGVHMPNRDADDSAGTHSALNHQPSRTLSPQDNESVAAQKQTAASTLETATDMSSVAEQTASRASVTPGLNMAALNPASVLPVQAVPANCTAVGQQPDTSCVEAAPCHSRSSEATGLLPVGITTYTGVCRLL